MTELSLSTGTAGLGGLRVAVDAISAIPMVLYRLLIGERRLVSTLAGLEAELGKLHGAIQHDRTRLERFRAAVESIPAPDAAALLMDLETENPEPDLRYVAEQLRRVRSSILCTREITAALDSALLAVTSYESSVQLLRNHARTVFTEMSDHQDEPLSADARSSLDEGIADAKAGRVSPASMSAEERRQRFEAVTDEFMAKHHGLLARLAK